MTLFIVIFGSPSHVCHLMSFVVHLSVWEWERECQACRASGSNSSILALLLKTNANQSALSTCGSLSLSLPVFKETVTLISCSSCLFLCPPLTVVPRTIPTTPLKSRCLVDNYYICLSQEKADCQWNVELLMFGSPHPILFAFVII